MPDFFTPDTPIAEAGRYIMAVQLETILTFEPELRETTGETAVHETRKAIRRTLTVFHLFEPFFIEEVVDYYRWQLKKVMRKLAHCRDLTVLLQKLTRFQAESANGRLLDALVDHYQEQKITADVELRHFMGKPKRQRFWEEYQQFVQATGKGAILAEAPFHPTKVKHVAPVLITQQVAAVRAHEETALDAPLAQLHDLRIHLKRLRYTLEFFSPVLGEEIHNTLGVVKELLDNLGHINDAYVTLKFFEPVKGLETAVSLYRAAKEEEIAQLRQEFRPLWQALNAASWRQNLGTAVAFL